MPRIYGPCTRSFGHPDTSISIGNVGRPLQAMGKLEETRGVTLEALEDRRSALGDDHLYTLTSIKSMSSLLNALCRHADAAELLLAGEAAARRVWTGYNARWLGNYLAKLGDARVGQREFAVGEKTLLEAYALLSAGFGVDHERTTKTIKRMIVLYDSWHAAELNKDYDAKAAEWRTKLVESEEESEVGGG